MLKTEYEEWKELLMKQPKEKLVDMIVLKMMKDHYFSDKSKMRLS